MVSSLDGMIASNDNSVSWFETSHYYDKGVISEDPEEFLKAIDCYIMGSKTYELAMDLSKEYGWAYGDKPIIVLTNRKLHTDKQNIEFYSGDLFLLVNERLRTTYKSVWVVGGSMISNEFIRLKLADEIHLSILPLILSDGLPFFKRMDQEQKLQLKDAKAYNNGMVELSYEIIK